MSRPLPLTEDGVDPDLVPKARLASGDATGRALAAHYGVTLVPTFVSIDAAGAEVQRIVGEQSKQRLAVTLREIRGVPCEVML